MVVNDVLILLHERRPNLDGVFLLETVLSKVNCGNSTGEWESLVPAQKKTP